MIKKLFCRAARALQPYRGYVAWFLLIAGTAFMFRAEFLTGNEESTIHGLTLVVCALALFSQRNRPRCSG